MNRIKKYFNIKYGLSALIFLLFPIIKDKWYIAIRYRLKMGYWMDFDHPITYTEKLQWLKLYNRRPEYTMMVDKYEVKRYVSEVIGSQYVIPTYAAYENSSQIDWDCLPEKFVLKTSNGGGGNNVFICQDKSSIDKAKVMRMMNQSLNYDIYRNFGEWPYKNVKPRIIAEELLKTREGDIRDYKFYCFLGEPKLVLVASNRFSTHNFDYFDIDFKHLDITSRCGDHSPSSIEKPENYELMVSLVRQLAKDIPHVRIDMYNCDGKIYFGEMTFYDSSGYDDLQSDEWNRRLGDWIKLPQKK